MIHFGQGWDVRNHRSNNASEAYTEGAMPKSKWNTMKKADLVEAIIEDAAEDDNEALRQALLRMSKSELIADFLKWEGWHHVGEGALLKQVDFFEINTENIEDVEITAKDREKAALIEEAKKAEREKEEKAEAFYNSIEQVAKRAKEKQEVWAKNEADYQSFKPELMRRLDEYAKGKKLNSSDLWRGVNSWSKAVDYRNPNGLKRAVFDYCKEKGLRIYPHAHGCDFYSDFKYEFGTSFGIKEYDTQL